MCPSHPFCMWFSKCETMAATFAIAYMGNKFRLNQRSNKVIDMKTFTFKDEPAYEYILL